MPLIINSERWKGQALQVSQNNAHPPANQNHCFPET